MTIEDVLKQYYSDNMFVKITRAIKLENDLKAMAQNDPRYGFFVYLIEKNTGGRYLFPENVLSLCNKLNIGTLDDLDYWCNYLDSSVIMPIVSPEINLALASRETNQKIETMIKSQAIIEENCLWDFGDPNYSLITKDELK